MLTTVYIFQIVLFHSPKFAGVIAHPQMNLKKHSYLSWHSNTKMKNVFKKNIADILFKATICTVTKPSFVGHTFLPSDIQHNATQHYNATQHNDT